MKEGILNYEDRIIEDFYTPLHIIKKEVWRRWNDKKLKEKVEMYLGETMPGVFSNIPRAALFRFIATPNLEFQLAYEISSLLGLTPVFMELLNDKFCTRNQDKIYMGKMMFFHRKIDGDVCITRKEKIIDIEKCDNKPFKEIETLWGENFVNFHHRLFNKKYPGIETFDVSSLKENGEKSYDLYLKIFTFFICNGVLFENYILNSDNNERKFTLEVARPAFNKVHEIFGVKPLILPLLSYKDCMSYQAWQYYSDDLITEI